MIYSKEIMYLEVGKSLELIQIWEQEFKLLTIRCKIEKSEDKRSLSNMNSFLFKNKIIDEEQYLSIKKIIEIRNYIIHKMYVETISFEDNIAYLLGTNKKISESIEFFKKTQNN